MNDERAGIKLATMLLIGVALGVMLGGTFGMKMGAAETTTKLTNEAVRERAGQWVPAEDGSPSFKWSVCVPAKPQEVKK